MSFKMRLSKRRGMPVLRIRGDLTGENIAKVMAKLDFLRKGKASTIVIDMGETTFIDSHGLGVFVYCWRLLEQEDRRMVFLKPQGFIRSMLLGTNLDKIFSVVDSEEDI
ncbi:MAG: STAS domain-containing protein [Chitinispirillaceae bacterium]